MRSILGIGAAQEVMQSRTPHSRLVQENPVLRTNSPSFPTAARRQATTSDSPGSPAAPRLRSSRMLVPHRAHRTEPYTWVSMRVAEALDSLCEIFLRAGILREDRPDRWQRQVRSGRSRRYNWPPRR